MFLKRSTSTILFSLGFIMALGCAHKAAQSETVSNTSQAAGLAGGSVYAVVDFKKGRYSLSDSDRATLSRLNQVPAKEGRKIDAINILAWADREYPEDGTKATRKDVTLAEKRADEIKKYLKDALHTPAEVDKQNMAERPGFFSEMMKTDTYKTKTAFEMTGAAPTEQQLSGNKSSKAVIFIKYK